MIVVTFRENSIILTCFVVKLEKKFKKPYKYNKNGKGVEYTIIIRQWHVENTIVLWYLHNMQGFYCIVRHLKFSKIPSKQLQQTNSIPFVYVHNIFHRLQAIEYMTKTCIATDSSMK